MADNTINGVIDNAFNDHTVTAAYTFVGDDNFPANSVVRALAAYLAAHDGAGADELNGNAAALNALLRDAIADNGGDNDIRKAKTLEEIKLAIKGSKVAGTNRAGAAAGGLAGAAGGDGDASPFNAGFADVIANNTGLAAGVTGVIVGTVIDNAFADYSVAGAFTKFANVIAAFRAAIVAGSGSAAVHPNAALLDQLVDDAVGAGHVIDSAQILDDILVRIKANNTAGTGAAVAASHGFADVIANGTGLTIPAGPVAG